MRSFEIVKSRVSPLRLVTAVLLAGAASSCSSDVTRFDGLFSSKRDALTTSSIPHKTNGRVPLPREDVANAGREDRTADAALNQPYPGNNDVAYDPISTSTTDTSVARQSVTPVRVQRNELSAPTPRQKVEEKVALAQPFPSKRILTTEQSADPIKTGTIKSVWHVSDASPRIMINSGDTLSAISVRYHVPQAEILKANKLKTGADLKFGKSIVIPVAVKVEKTKQVPVELALDKKKIPVPGKQPEQDKAVLPTTATRDKNKAADAKLASNDGKSDAADTGAYQVKEGDSLARIARQHKISVDQLKAANNMETASLKIGQKLVIPDGAMVTASIPTKKSEVKEAAEASKPKTYTPPVAEKSVEEVQKTADNGEKAPDETGIGKYRWPVRGAVIAGYGQNVDGVRNAGIDISVPEGTPIKSAENGVVIYAGSGLKDLGNTVLVRHDDGTVTVYGNASNLNVKRGDKVNRGQVIAASGMTGGAKRPKVHFEVRQNAVAVNPMTFLQ